MKAAAGEKWRRELSLRGPLCAGEAFCLRRLLRRAAAHAKRVAPVVASSSTPHFAAAPRIMLLACGQARESYGRLLGGGLSVGCVLDEIIRVGEPAEEY